MSAWTAAERKGEKVVCRICGQDQPKPPTYAEWVKNANADGRKQAPSTPPSDKAKKDSDRIKELEAEKRNWLKREKPVSYTHLTLPTKA